MKFRMDNTEGYSPGQISELNRRYEAALKDASSMADAEALAGKVLADYEMEEVEAAARKADLRPRWNRP